MIHSVFNPYKNKEEIETFPGEEICPNCHGLGLRNAIFPSFPLRCRVCRGEGKIDWIQKAMGVE